MAYMNKKVLIGALVSGAFLAGMFASPFTYAATQNATSDKNAKPTAHAPKTIDIDAAAKEVATVYGVKESEVKKAFNDQKPVEDIYQAALFAKVSGKSFQSVLAMKADWFDVGDKLGIDPAKVDAAMEDVHVKEISVRSDVAESEVRRLLKEHYHPRDIETAGRLAKASGKDIQSVLDMKKINQRWGDVAEVLGVKKDIVHPHGMMDEEAPEKNDNGAPDNQKKNK